MTEWKGRLGTRKGAEGGAGASRELAGRSCTPFAVLSKAHFVPIRTGRILRGSITHATRRFIPSHRTTRGRPPTQESRHRSAVCSARERAADAVVLRIGGGCRPHSRGAGFARAGAADMGPRAVVANPFEPRVPPSTHTGSRQ